jgi:hypothetical protein
MKIGRRTSHLHGRAMRARGAPKGPHSRSMGALPPRHKPSMSSAEHILARLPEISGACERAGVWHLWVFSSAACGEWREDSSDIDSLVELNPTQPLPSSLSASTASSGRFSDARSTS